MNPKKRWTRQLFTWVAAFVFILVALVLINKIAVRYPLHKTTAPRTTNIGDWIFISVKADDPLSRFSGRPGRLVSRSEFGENKVEYQLQEGAVKELIPIPQNVALHGCPPQQEAVDGKFVGTIRIWNGSESKLLENQNEHEAKVGDTVTVEVKNLDRWLFAQFDFGRLKSELDDVPATVKDVVSDAVAARRSAELLRGVNKINYALRIKLRDDTATTKEDRKKAWQELAAIIDNDGILKRIRDKMPEKLEGDEPTVENIGKLERQFLPIKVWSHRVTERRFKQLTLTLNGIALPATTPQNAYNEAEVVHERRPSFQDDFYQWGRFVLERKPVSPTATDAANEVAKANESAWIRLIGKPAFWLPCNVTLKLPQEDLELPTKVTVDASDPDCRFYLVGIELWKFLAAADVFFFILWFLFWLAKTTNILRDSSGRVRPDGLEPVSLGKTQMAFWFIVTACAFAFLWVTTGNYDTINDTCLILVGIGSGTALGAVFIESAAPRFLVTSSMDESRKHIQRNITDAILIRVKKLSRLVTDPDIRKRVIAVLQHLENEKNDQGPEQQTDPSSHQATVELRKELEKEWQLDEQLDAAETKEKAADALIALARKLNPPPQPGVEPPPLDEAKILANELELLAVQRAQFQKMAKDAWKRLFADWLSEGTSDKYSFHRFQMLAWTMVLGFVFIAKVISDRSMPEFNAMTLGLLGISAGTYLGFKIPESRKQETTQTH
jgi:hypothetical protein